MCVHRGRGEISDARNLCPSRCFPTWFWSRLVWLQIFLIPSYICIHFVQKGHIPICIKPFQYFSFVQTAQFEITNNHTFLLTSHFWEAKTKLLKECFLPAERFCCLFTGYLMHWIICHFIVLLRVFAQLLKGLQKAHLSAFQQSTTWLNIPLVSCNHKTRLGKHSMDLITQLAHALWPWGEKGGADRDRLAYPNSTFCFPETNQKRKKTKT